MLNHLKCAFVRVSDAVGRFPREPGRAIAAAGLAFGGVFAAQTVATIENSTPSLSGD